MSAKLSILIPIYDVEDYLRRCLDSICEQTLRDLEIICINDGSTDHSLDIIKEYQNKDSRIVLIDKPNSGYGDSMNQGLAQATGKYIGIVEPDDYIELDGFEKLYHLAEKYHADVVKANYFTEQSDKTTPTSEICAQKFIERKSVTDFPEDYRTLFKFTPSIWSAIYRRDFLRKYQIQFLPSPGASYQDLGFNFKVWSMAQRIVLAPDRFIHYGLDNQNSSVNNPKKVMCVVDEYREIANFLEQQGIITEFGPLMAEAKFRNYHWNLQRLAPEPAKTFYQTFRQEMRELDQKGLLHRADFSRSHWLALQFILKHPHLAYNILRIHSKIH